MGLLKRSKPLVEIRDHVLWPKHIINCPELQAELIDLNEGEVVGLVVDGFRGMWEKMRDGKDGKPMPGMKPVGKAKEHWHSLQDRRGELVTIKPA